MNRRKFLRSAAGAAGLALTKPILARTAGTTALNTKNGWIARYADRMSTGRHLLFIFI